MSKIDYVRFALYALLLWLAFALYQTWDKEHPILTPSAQSAYSTTASNYIPASERRTEASASSPDVITRAPSTHHYIHIKTDVLDVNIDTHGGNINQVLLSNYPQQLHSQEPFILLNDSTATRFIAQSGLLSTNGPDTTQGQAIYKTEKSTYVLGNNQQELQVVLTWENQHGLKIRKVFTFTRGSYEIGLTYEINNKMPHTWQGNLYTQLLRTNSPPALKQGFVNLATYFGAAISSADKPFEKVSFKNMERNQLNKTITGGWAAMIQHYFISAWIPDKNALSNYFSRVTQDGLYIIGMVGPTLIAEPGKQINTHANFYAGPAQTELLKKAAPGLQLTIDYGWFWFISMTIFWLMQNIYKVVGNWGWSIVLVTMLIKIVFYQLSAKSYRSMSAMKKMQPRIAMLKERYGSDKQKFTQATLELYKKEKVNPMSGCLPILIQIPVFIGLYWVLIESVELRQAPFILWIQDLSTRDPYYILPLFMGISMYLQQRLNPPASDPLQQKVMMFMPIIFTALFINFPAGLMLYWFVNNIISFLQQWFIMHNMEKTNKV